MTNGGPSCRHDFYTFMPVAFICVNDPWYSVPPFNFLLGRTFVMAGRPHSTSAGFKRSGSDHDIPLKSSPPIPPPKKLKHGSSHRVRSPREDRHPLLSGSEPDSTILPARSSDATSPHSRRGSTASLGQHRPGVPLRRGSVGSSAGYTPVVPTALRPPTPSGRSANEYVETEREVFDIASHFPDLSTHSSDEHFTNKAIYFNLLKRLSSVKTDMNTGVNDLMTAHVKKLETEIRVLKQMQIQTHIMMTDISRGGTYKYENRGVVELDPPGPPVVTEAHPSCWPCMKRSRMINAYQSDLIDDECTCCIPGSWSSWFS